VSHANAATTRYGVEVLSINIISAAPADASLIQSLAKGAVAAAEAPPSLTTPHTPYTPLHSLHARTRPYTPLFEAVQTQQPLTPPYTPSPPSHALTRPYTPLPEAVQAQQLETTARGRAKAATIDARGGAEALQISASADASADVTRAEGSKRAAELLNEQPVAVQLATIGATGKALEGARSSLIFGSDPGRVSSLLSNPHLTSTALGMPT